jgi:hypothetical protein
MLQSPQSSFLGPGAVGKGCCDKPNREERNPTPPGNRQRGDRTHNAMQYYRLEAQVKAFVETSQNSSRDADFALVDACFRA